MLVSFVLGSADKDVMHHISPELVLVDPALAAAIRELLPDPADCLAPRPRDAASPAIVLEPEPSAVCPPAVPLSVPLVERREPELSRSQAADAAGVASPAERFRRPAAPTPAPRRVERPAAKPPRSRRGWLTVPVAAAWLLMTAILASPLLAFLPPDDSTRPRLVDESQEPSSEPRRSADAPPAPRPGTTNSPSDTARAAPTRPARRGTVVIRWRPVPRAAYYNVILVRGGERVDFWPKKASIEIGRTAGTGPRAEWYSWFVYPAFREQGVVRHGRVIARGTVQVSRDSIRAGRVEQR